LLKKYQTYSQTKIQDLLDNPFVINSNKNIFQNAYAHLMNAGTDMGARMVSMVAIMLKDGTWNSYEYDAKEDKAKYNKLKDERFYANGKEKREHGEHVIKEAIRRDLIAQGKQNPKDKDLVEAYSYKQINDLMKWYADNYIIGAMDNYSKPILGNRVIGQALQNFRVFAFPRLFNMGIFGSTRKVTKGVTYKAIKDANGEWISKQEVLEIEGALQSFAKALNVVRGLGDQSLNDWWKNDASEITKFNIVKTMVQVSLFALLYGLVSAAWDDDRFAYLYGDIFIGPTITDIMTGDLFPVVQQVNRFVDASMGGDAEAILKSFGGTRTIINTMDTIDVLSE
jgi:hypothetical protein